MNQDYFIDDQDGYNWVTLSKPLSSYTKEELADQLIKNNTAFALSVKQE